MKIEILHIDECPHWAEAGARVREALDAIGRADVPIEYRLLRTSDDAAAVQFAGSPTILVDGADAFPSGARTTDLACRIYSTPAGLAGVPTTEQLVETFRRLS
jgi:hypothetical protein